ncbi:MAG TPA: hypothetical protein VIJ94_11735 [Caulobacteraceae bacterium]
MGIGVDKGLLEALYDEALYAGNWRPALEAVATALGSDEVSVVTIQRDKPNSFFSTGRLLSPEACERYARDFHAIDPKLAVLAGRPPGFVFNDISHFDDAFVARNTFYQEYSRSIGTRHTLDTRLETDRGSLYFAAMRRASRGYFQPATARKFQAIASHVGRVWTLTSRTAAAELRADHAAAALDSLGFGLVAFDPAGTVRMMNAFVRSMLDEGDIQWRQGRLVIRHTSANRDFQNALERACAEGASFGAQTARIPRAMGGCWVVTVTALPAHSSFAAAARGALAIFCDPDERVQVRRDDLIRLFGLTPAEAELCLAVGMGQTLDEFATARGVRRSTARSQLEAILSKTGLHRQVDLARMIANLPGARLA